MATNQTLNGSFTANGSITASGTLIVNSAITANSSNGTAGQFLTSSGSGVYWSDPPAGGGGGGGGVNTAASYTWTNNHTYATGTTLQLGVASGGGSVTYGEGQGVFSWTLANVVEGSGNLTFSTDPESSAATVVAGLSAGSVLTLTPFEGESFQVTVQDIFGGEEGTIYFVSVGAGGSAGSGGSFATGSAPTPILAANNVTIKFTDAANTVFVVGNNNLRIGKDDYNWNGSGYGIKASTSSAGYSSFANYVWFGAGGSGEYFKAVKLFGQAPNEKYAVGTIQYSEWQAGGMLSMSGIRYIANTDYKDAFQTVSETFIDPRYDSTVVNATANVYVRVLPFTPSVSNAHRNFMIVFKSHPTVNTSLTWETAWFKPAPGLTLPTTIYANTNPVVSGYIEGNYFYVTTVSNKLSELDTVTIAGSLGVGTAASGTTGEIRATNNITAYYSSDKKFKENIKDVDGALEKVCAIGSKTFEWTDEYIQTHGGEDGYFVRKSDFGVIAQDVQAVFPQAVRTREDGTLAVDYEKLAVLSFGAIKELVKRIEALEAK